MPEVCRFFGITIGMYFEDHSPPHFHAVYGDSEMTVEIISGAVHGHFPRRGQRLVLEWSRMYREELLQNWERAREGKSLLAIAPLE